MDGHPARRRHAAIDGAAARGGGSTRSGQAAIRHGSANTRGPAGRGFSANARGPAGCTFSTRDRRTASIEQATRRNHAASSDVHVRDSRVSTGAAAGRGPAGSRSAGAPRLSAAGSLGDTASAANHRTTSRGLPSPSTRASRGRCPTRSSGSAGRHARVSMLARRVAGTATKRNRRADHQPKNKQRCFANRVHGILR